MIDTKEIIDDISSMYDEFTKLERRIYSKMEEYCEILNEKYRNRIGEKITAVKCEYYDYYGGFVFFGGFRTETTRCRSIVPILYYPTKKGEQSKRQVLAIRQYTFNVIKELEEKI